MNIDEWALEQSRLLFDIHPPVRRKAAIQVALMKALIADESWLDRENANRFCPQCGEWLAYSFQHVCDKHAILNRRIDTLERKLDQIIALLEAKP